MEQEVMIYTLRGHSTAHHAKSLDSVLTNTEVNRNTDKIRALLIPFPTTASLRSSDTTTFQLPEFMLWMHSGDNTTWITHSKVNLTGGYYDVGDNVKFGWPMSFSVALLSWAASEYETEISKSGELGHLRTAIRWGTDFILKAHVSSTMLYTQVGDGNSDHQCWECPEDMDTPRTLYKITSSSLGTAPVADAVAALASTPLFLKTKRVIPLDS